MKKRMHYVIAGFKRVSTLIHILVLKVLYGKKFMCAGIGNIDNTSHFAIQDSGRIVLGKKK